MRFQFIRHNWKIFAALIAVSFVCGLVGSLAGNTPITGLCALVANLIFFVWIGRYILDSLRITALYNSGKYEESIKLCEKIIARHPKDAQAFVNLSAAYVALSKPVEALNFADKALAIDSTLAQAYNNRSMANLQMNVLCESLDDIERAINLTPNSNKTMQSHLLATRANVLARCGEADAALEDCEQSLKLQPSSLFALLTRAHCYCLANRNDDAIADLEKACPPSSPTLIRGYALTSRARVYLKKGNLEAALADANDSIICCPDMAPLIATRGLVLTRAKQFEEALVDLNRAIELDSYLAEAYWFRYELYAAMGRKIESESDKEIATKYQYHPYL
ncbi:hypothetical protein BH10CYA1_BH10CYA1_04630 [soil metagenome]